MTGAPAKRQRSIRRIAIILFGLGVSVLAAWLAIRGVDLGRTAQVLGQVSPAPLAIVAVALVIQVLVRSARWSRLLPAGQRGSVPARRLVPVVLVGYLGNTVLPARLGDPLRALVVGRREAIPASGALGSVVLERAIDTLTLALLVFPAAALSGSPYWLIRAAAFAAALAGSVLIAAQTRLPSLMIGRVRRSARGPRWTPWLNRADRFASAMDSAGRRRAVLSAVGLSLLAWLLDGTIYWAAARSLGIELPPAGAMLVSAITVLGTAIPSAPGYVGTFELAASTIAGGLGVLPAAALAFAILVHALTALPLALGGVVALAWIGVRFGDLARVAAGQSPSGRDHPPGPAEVTAP
jgi:glycosyltransferase 2 family protein